MKTVYDRHLAEMQYAHLIAIVQKIFIEDSYVWKKA